MQLHDVRGVARILGISPWTVRAAIREGKLRPVRIGRLVRVEESEILRFITQATDKAASAPLQSA
jgi:excisionase family DNA binding protein